MKRNNKERKVAGRVSFIYGFVFLSLSGLIFRLAYLQINQGANLRSLAANQQISYVPVLPERGWIYDANHQLLAYDVPAMDVTITRLHNSSIQNFSTIASLLAPVLKVSKSDLLYKMQKENTWQDQVYLSQDANEAQVSYVEEHKSELPGVELVVSSKRSYPHGDLAGQVIGYVGSIQGDEAKQYPNYLLNQIVGQSGIESQYEKYLQGKPGKSAIVINNMGIPIQSLGLDPPPTPGDTVQLTLDGHLQAATQQILTSKIDDLATQGVNVNQAAAVVLNPKTGAVLSMVSYPYLDPNWYLNPSEYQKHVQELNHFPSPAYNNATQGIYMPGSTVKPGNILLGLLDKVITPTTTVNDTNELWIGNYLAHGDAAEGIVDAVKAIEVSDDIFMYKLGMWLGHYPPANMSTNKWLTTVRTQALNSIFSFEKALGLGIKTGIDLPNESKGTFTDSGQLYDLPFSEIGQIQAFTPLQLADYVSTIANNGVRMQPHLLQSIKSPSGKTVETYQPKVAGKVAAPQTDWDILHQGMYLVANGSLGTAASSFTDAPYKAAGKTGTAQQGGGQNDISVFIGYAPYNNPQIAVAVVMPGAGYGADGAVPVTREIMDAYFKEHHEFFPQSQWANMKIPN